MRKQRQQESNPNKLVSGPAVFSDAAWSALGKSLRLTRRELQIVRSVFNDRKEMAIASDLGISAHTVHTHVQRLHHKLEVVDRVSLVMRVLDEFFKLILVSPAVLPPICPRREAGQCPVLRRWGSDPRTRRAIS